eukprot:1180703-Prorocentrum_minimum.AAC.2
MLRRGPMEYVVRQWYARDANGPASALVNDDGESQASQGRRSVCRAAGRMQALRVSPPWSRFVHVVGWFVRSFNQGAKLTSAPIPVLVMARPPKHWAALSATWHARGRSW